MLADSLRLEIQKEIFVNGVANTQDRPIRKGILTK